MVQNLLILSGGNEPSLPILEIIPFGPISFKCCYAANSNSFNNENGGSGLHFLKNSIAST
jgi:hypothetical protein